jgi:hypothetical protein
MIPVWVTVSNISVNWGGQCKGCKGGAEKEGDLLDLTLAGETC